MNLRTANMLSTRGTLGRAIVATAVVAAGVVLLQAAVAALNWTINKPPMPLRHPLPTLSKELGTPLVYAGKPDSFMDEASLQALGTADYLLREYTDLRRIGEGEGTPGGRLMLNINYYATGSSSPHVPDVCWQASGRERHPTLGEQEFLLKNVRHQDGTVSDVKMRMLSFKPTPGEWSHRPQGLEDDAKYLRNVAYTFNVNGKYVANRHEVESQFWRPGNKHAYHMKIEVTIPVLCAPDVARPLLEDFLREILPEVEKCLPDPNADAAGPSTQAAGATTSTMPAASAVR